VLDGDAIGGDKKMSARFTFLSDGASKLKLTGEFGGKKVFEDDCSK
jgi:hypothetical protein